MDSMQKIFIEVEIKNTRGKLISETESLISDLQYMVEQLKLDVDYEPNSLGVVQGSGSSIDVLCGKLNTLKNIQEVLNEK